MHNKIKQVFELTEEILSAAEQHDWDKIEPLQNAREQLIAKTELLPTPEDEDESQRIREMITAIQEMDTRIAPLLLKQKNSLIEETLQNNKGRKMNKAYQNNK